MSWPVVPIGKVIISTQYGLSVSSDADGNIPIVGMKDIQGGRVLIDHAIRVALPDEESEDYRLKKGDILINRTNSPDLVGKTGLVLEDQNAVFASYLVRIKINESQAEPAFITYCMNSEAGQRQMRTLSTRAISQANINPSTFKKHFHIPLPPLDAQHEIATILCTWDTAIEKTTRLIVGKENQKKSIMQALLTAKRRSKGFRKSWSEFHLGELFSERSESASGHLPLLSITRGEGVIPRNDGDRKDTSSEDKSKYLRICPRDIGYNTMRMWQGVSALSSLEGIISPAYTVCTPKKGVDGQFMAYLFKLPHTINLFYRYSQGLTSDTWNLKFHHFKGIKVKIPELDEQRAIAKVLKACDEEIKLLKKQTEAYRKQKRGLMQKLLTGQWRIKVGRGIENG